jgi:DNA replication protein DnaC
MPQLERQRKSPVSGILRIRAERFAQTKSLDAFGFIAQPSLNKALVVELTRCEWIEKRQNRIAPGPYGSGKAHVGLALGLASHGTGCCSVSF